jgi:Fe-S-cluster containining protein
MPSETRPPGPVDLDSADDELVRRFDEAMERSTRQAGPLFGCGPGHTRCCRGPFPVNLLDARRLERGMAALDVRDPARAKAVRRRARRVVRRFAGSFPGEARTGLLDDDQEVERRFCARHARVMCPALDGASGLCDLYDWRPLACRSMGPPVRFGGVDLPPCPYCFRPAPADEIERCRAVPDPDGREDRVLAELEARLGRSGDTLIAFALLGLPTARR